MLGELAIDYGSRRVSVAGRAVDLTATEYELLRVLSLNAGRVTAYDTLLRRVWGEREHANANLVRIFVRNLRPKLGDSAADMPHVAGRRRSGPSVFKGDGREMQEGRPEARSGCPGRLRDLWLQRKEGRKGSGPAC